MRPSEPIYDEAFRRSTLSAHPSISHVCVVRPAPPSGAIPLQPCLPRRAITPPTGDGWIHEMKHDGFRIVARREGDRVRLFTRNGYDFTARFPKIAAAVAGLPVRSCVVDGEAIVVNPEGLSVFDLLRYRHHDHAACCAFDLDRARRLRSSPAAARAPEGHSR